MLLTRLLNTARLTFHTPFWGNFVRTLIIMSTLALLGAWLFYTPPGLLGKADAVGYAVCHRIPDRSFFIADRPSPLCARCSGMYLGALAGMIYLFSLGRIAGLPDTKTSIFLGILFVAFGVDGVNSYLGFIPSIPRLYESQNSLRLLTGSGVGLGIAALVVPVLHQTFWRAYDPRPQLHTWRQIGILLALMLGVDLLTLSDIPLLLYPLFLLSAATILIVLTLIYSLLLLMLLRRENRFDNWRSLFFYLLGGFNIALLQIALMDAGRFAITGTWQGFFTNGTPF